MLAEYPGVPDDYVNFLRHHGWGSLDEVALYGGLIDPEFVYGTDEAAPGVMLFCDDYQGYCFGFDLNNGYRVVQVDPFGVVETFDDLHTFMDLMVWYFNTEAEDDEPDHVS